MSLVTIAAPRDGPIVALQTPIDCPVVLSTRRLLIVEIAVSSQVPGVVGNRSSAASRRLPETIATAPIPAATAARNLSMASSQTKVGEAHLDGCDTLGRWSFKPAIP